MTEKSRRSVAFELALLWCGVIWLQVVGLVTDTVLHHVLHAVPLAVLGFTRGGYWTRHTRAMAGLIWVLMLTLFTPMIWHVLSRGITFADPSLAYTWLAPAMLIIAAGWSAASVAALRAKPTAWPLAWFAIVLAGLALAAAQPLVGTLMEAPVARVLSGHVGWVPVLVVEVLLIAGIGWGIVRVVAPRPLPAITWRMSLAQVSYWIGFVACMVAGLAVDAA